MGQYLYSIEPPPFRVPFQEAFPIRMGMLYSSSPSSNTACIRSFAPRGSRYFCSRDRVRSCAFSKL